MKTDHLHLTVAALVACMGFAMAQNIDTLPSLAGAAVDKANDKLLVRDASVSAAAGALRSMTIEELANVPGFFPHSEVVYASDYGVTADGVADDTEELQAALDAAGGAGKSHIVWLPVGTMKITAELVIKNRVWLRGHGWSKSIIMASTAGQNGIWFNSGAHDNCQFDGFALFGPAGHGGNGVTGGVGILTDSKTNPGSYVYGPTGFSNVWVSRWATAIKVGQLPLFNARHCYFGGYRLHGVHMVSTDTFQFDTCTVGMGTNAIDAVQAGGTSILLEGSAEDPAGANFAGEFSNCELGDTWKFLTLSGCRIAFESCNFETRGGAGGLTTARSMMDVAAGSRLTLRNCRFGLGATSTDAGSEALTTIRGNAVSAEPRIILDNTDPASGLYTLAVSIRGADAGYFAPMVLSGSVPVKWFDAGGVEIQSMPQCSNDFYKRGNGWFSGNANTHANALASHGALTHYWSPDTYADDELLLMARKTRKTLGGVRQYTRSSLTNDSLMEVLAASITTTTNSSAARLILTNTAVAVPAGTMRGTGDLLTLKARGTCAANANVKTFSLGNGGTENTATRLTVSDATATYWEYSVELYGNDVAVGSAVRLIMTLTAYDAAGVQVHHKKLPGTWSGFTADITPTVLGQSDTASDITCHGWDLIWRANAYKP